MLLATLLGCALILPGADDATAVRIRALLTEGWETGAYDKAQVHIAALGEAKEKNKGAVLAIALAKLRHNLPKSAADELAAAKLTPNALALLLVAWTSAAQGEHDRALDEFERAVSVARKQPAQAPMVYDALGDYFGYLAGGGSGGDYRLHLEAVRLRVLTDASPAERERVADRHALVAERLGVRPAPADTPELADAPQSEEAQLTAKMNQELIQIDLKIRNLFAEYQAALQIAARYAAQVDPYIRERNKVISDTESPVFQRLNIIIGDLTRQQRAAEATAAQASALAKKLKGQRNTVVRKYEGLIKKAKSADAASSVAPIDVVPVAKDNAVPLAEVCEFPFDAARQLLLQTVLTPQERKQLTLKGRIWTDRRGKRGFVAEMVRTDVDRIVLRSPTGKEISVPLDSLSHADQDFVDRLDAPAVAVTNRPTRPLLPELPASGRINILAAMYGINQNWFDATDKLRELAQGQEKWEALVADEDFGDPAPGYHLGNTLVVRYSLGDHVGFAIVYQGKPIGIPAADLGKSPPFDKVRETTVEPTQIHVTSAIYGINQSFLDVTEKVREKVAGRAKWASVVDDADYGDPAPDYHVGNTLIVRYLLQGKAYLAVAYHGKEIELGANVAPLVPQSPAPVIKFPLAGKFEIERATFGAGDKQADVTDIVRGALAKDPYSPLAPDGRTMGDPAPGQAKQLVVSYVLNGKSETLTVAEGQAGSPAPQAAEGVALGGASQPFKVLAARYGIGLSWVNVTQCVADRVLDPAESVSWSALTVEDPLPGPQKQVVVWFDYQGKRYCKQFPEGEFQPLLANVQQQVKPVIFDQKVKRDAWSQERQETRDVGSNDKTFALMAEVAGNLLGGGEQLRISLAKNKQWQVSGATQQPIAIHAFGVESPLRDKFKSEVEQFNWSGGEAVKMIHSSEGFCVLSAVGGAFNGLGEEARVYIHPDDGFWYLAGRAASPINASALAYRLKERAGVKLRYAEFHWRPGMPVINMLKEGEGFCFLASIGGDFAGYGEVASIHHSENGYWAFMCRGVKAIHTRAYSVRVVP